MKNSSVLIILFAISLSAFAQTTQPSLNELNWLAGCWESNKNGIVSMERWSKPSGNMMLSTSQTVKGSKTISFEFLRIIENETGIYYISKPSENKEETAFKLIKFNNNEVVFENPEHDFPQRIIYKLEKGTSLFARIEGKKNGKEMGINFPMNRTKCE
ncbi:MAG TPA: DUF6265 family protein [Pyrinomonadaceae bacterium]|nr:DUF6265 family protein [Pyrinomonadaceae bacterium]